MKHLFLVLFLMTGGVVSADVTLLEQIIAKVNNEIITKSELERSRKNMELEMRSRKITEENIQQAFDIKYGAQAKIRDIQVANIKDAQEVRRRLAAGEKFEEVARSLSQDARTAPPCRWMNVDVGSLVMLASIAPLA